MATLAPPEPLAMSPVDPLLDLWLFGKAPLTVRAYRGDVAQFLTWVGNPDPTSWTVADLQGWANSLTTGGASPATIARKLGAVKSFLTYGHKLGLIPLNVGAAVPAAPPPARLADRILTEAEMAQLIGGIQNPAHQIFTQVLYSTGCRISELCALTWGDVTDRGDVVQLTITGKGAKIRYVLVRANLWERVTAIAGENRQGAVFTTSTGRPHSRGGVYQWMARAGVKILGRKISPHWIRHSHASHALDRNAPIHTVRATLGHSSLQTTERYLHARPGDSSGLYLPL